MDTSKKRRSVRLVRLISLTTLSVGSDELAEKSISQIGGISRLGDGCDEVFDIECVPCRLGPDALSKEAIGYCKDCGHHLCKTCFDCHCVPLPTRNHVLVDRHHMPTTQESIQELEYENLDACPLHRGKLMEYYCNFHDSLACVACVSLYHNNCTGVSFIECIEDKIGESDEYKLLQSKLSSLEQLCKQHVQVLQENLIKSTKYHTQALDDITAFRNEINNTLDKMESEIRKEITNIKDSGELKIKSFIQDLGELEKELQTMSSKLDRLQGEQLKSKLFIAVKQFKREIKTLEECVHYIEKGNHVKQYTFERNSELENICELDVFGKCSAIKDLKQYSASHIGDVNVRRHTTIFSKDSYISGSTIMSGGELVVVDNRNHWVRLLDSSGRRIKCSVKLELPWDVVETRNYQLAITLPNDEKIQLVSVSERPTFAFTLTETIQTDGKCRGIAYSQEQLIVSLNKSTGSGCVQIINMYGNALMTIHKDENARELFEEPDHVAISPDNKTLYVTDSKSHKVISLTMKGKVKAIYKDKLWCPTGVTVGSDGTVYACGLRSHEVHVLSPDFSRSSVLLRKSDELYCPESLSFSSTLNNIYIGMKEANFVKVFHLTNDSKEYDIVDITN